MTDSDAAALAPLVRYLLQALGVAELCEQYRALSERRLRLAAADPFDRRAADKYEDITDVMDDLAYEITRALIDAQAAPDECERRVIDIAHIRRLSGDGGLSNA